MTYSFNTPFDTSKFQPISGMQRLSAEGVYNLRLTNFDKVQTRNGKDALQFRFSVYDGPHAGQIHIEQMYLWLEDQDKANFAARIVAEIMRALMGGDGIVESGDQVIGRICTVTCIQDGEYQGRPQYALRNWCSYNGGSNDKNDESSNESDDVDDENEDDQPSTSTDDHIPW